MEEKKCDYSQAIDNVYENLEGYEPKNKRRVLIVLDDIIADMESNEKLSPIVTGLFQRKMKLNIPLVLHHNLISKCLKL